MTTPPANNRVRELRVCAGLSQAELAIRAGISRTAVTAIEGGRLVPSVQAALGIAGALATTVEALFGSSCKPAIRWASPPPSPATPCWRATVGDAELCYPANAAPMYSPLPDEAANSQASRASETLVLACCDPAVGWLASHFAATTGLRMLVLPRSSRQSLELLREGLVHVAGLHLATDDQPDQNSRAATDVAGSGLRMCRVAHWHEGVAMRGQDRVRSLAGLNSSRLRWVGREAGSGARQCLDRVLENRPSPSRIARNHQGVTEAILSGWADAGICVQLAASEAGLNFLPVQREAYDLCYRADFADDRRLKGLLATLRSKTYRQLLASLPGYETAETGLTWEIA